MNRIDVDAVNALRVLAADEVQKANSGHPGLPLGAAPAAYTVWAYEMKHNPRIIAGKIVTDLFCLADMDRRYFMHCFICSGMG